jgi:hypothetical protein
VAQAVKPAEPRFISAFLLFSERFFPIRNHYDHAVRDDRESDRIKGYIENNPVKAGLVANAEDYLGSSADRDRG